MTEPAGNSRYDGRHVGMRDPGYIRRVLPVMEFGYRSYFRVQESGVECLPAAGPALVVGNHSGGIVAPDVAMTMYIWLRERGPDVAAYGLVDPRMFADRKLAEHVVRCGGLAAHPKVAMEALEQDAVVLVYPGGARDAYRPYSQRHDIQLGGNRGFVKLALRYGVPIVPVVTAGAHETVLVIDDGEELARELGLDEQHGIDRLPISLALFGLEIGAGYHVPYPAQIRIAFGDPIHFPDLRPKHARDRAAVEACYQLVLQQMRSLLNGLLS